MLTSLHFLFLVRSRTMVHAICDYYNVFVYAFRVPFAATLIVAHGYSDLEITVALKLYLYGRRSYCLSLYRKLLQP